MNQFKTVASYSQHKATRRLSRARQFAREQAAHGAGNEIDYSQALIDLMTDTAQRMDLGLYEKLTEAGYNVPAETMPWSVYVADLEANDGDLTENEARRRRAQNGRV